MAPEYPQVLVIFDARIEDDRLKGTIQYVEMPVGKRLRVRWESEDQPEGFHSLVGGVAYVLVEGGVTFVPESRAAVPQDLGDSRYRWTEGLPPDVPWQMFVLILPAGHTFEEPRPRPARAKAFGERIAAYWILKPDALGRTAVECRVKELREDLRSDVQRLNRLCDAAETSSRDSIDVEDATSAIQVRPPPGKANVDRLRPGEPKQAGSTHMVDFFVSYTKPDAAWAEWIAWVLEEAGYSVRIQAWDFRPGANFVLEMQQAAAEAGRTIAVLSEDYSRSGFAASEWAAAFSQDARGKQRKLVPVRVRQCNPEGLLQSVVYVDLVGLNEGDAEAALLGAFSQRAKPLVRPNFPGSQAAPRVAPDHKPFPGQRD
jgi:hypothetical protein